MDPKDLPFTMPATLNIPRMSGKTQAMNTANIQSWQQSIMNMKFDTFDPDYQVYHTYQKEEPMLLEKVLKLYVTSMAGDVRSPTPHLFGPPGCGKSTVVEEVADLLGVTLHTINVSRISPLELEGVQMPNAASDGLDMLTASFWTRMKDGDILLLDEFLRGFPEVYNGLLDILTSRRVGSFVLPKVFIIAASNSTVAYDVALEDRLMHIKVPDIRTDKKEFNATCRRLVEATGMLPEMAKSDEVINLIKSHVLPTYNILDRIANKGSTAVAGNEGKSLRNIIGQIRMREPQDPAVRVVMDANLQRAMREKKPQYYLLVDGNEVSEGALRDIKSLLDLTTISAQQRVNAELNIQLAAGYAQLMEKRSKEDVVDIDPFVPN